MSEGLGYTVPTCCRQSSSHPLGGEHKWGLGVKLRRPAAVGPVQRATSLRAQGAASQPTT